MSDYQIELWEPMGSVIAQVPTASGKTLTMSVDEGETFAFSISGNNPVAPLIRDMITDVVVYRENEKIFRGRIVQSTDSMDGATNTISVSCVDYKSLLKRRFIYTPNSGTIDLELAAWNLINYTQTRGAEALHSLGITRGANQTHGRVMPVKWEVGSTIKDTIDTLAKTVSAEQVMDNFEWHIDPELVYRHYVPGRGREVPIFSCDFGGSVLSFDTGFDPNGYANLFRVQGAGSLLQWYGTPDIGRWPGSMFEEFINDSNLTTIGQVDASAFWNATFRGQLDKLRTYNLEISASRWGGPSQLWVGDYVFLELRQGRINVNTSDYRVLNMHLEIDDNGQEHLGIEVGYVPTATYRDFARMNSFMLYTRRQILAQRATWFKSQTQSLQNQLTHQERTRGRKSYPANAARKRLADFKVVYSKWQTDQTQRG